ncbi:MAG: DUF559 domain-containing protein [Actinobacteria bacterium]|nr:DUF559 domain-containing protein [Actinomycetota bacterium]
MTERQVLGLASRQYGSFSRVQALDLGVDDDVARRRLSAGRWVRHAPGVYGLPGWPVSWRRSLWAAYLDAGPGAVVSHESAAALHELTSFRPGPLTLTVAHGAHQRPGEATVHQSRDLATVHCVRIDGFPVTTVERTLIDLAATTRRARLALALDDACLTRRCRLQDVRALFEELRRPGKPGMRRLGLLLAARGPGYVPPDSVLERRLLRVLSRGGIRPPVLQASLPWRASCPNRVDGLYRSERVIVECDGRRWHSRMETMAEDRRRDREAQLHGYRVYRFVWEEVTKEATMVCATLRRALDSGA